MDFIFLSSYKIPKIEIVTVSSSVNKGFALGLIFKKM
jgi:hypothetical protein